MRGAHVLMFGCCVVALGCVAVPAAAQSHQRDSWYIGFGLGSGEGTYQVGDKTYYSSELGNPDFDPIVLSLNFKAGATLSDELLLGIDISALSAQVNENRVSAIVQHNAYNVALTWFPLQEGVFLRGGIGLAALVAQVTVDDRTSFEDQVSGFGLQVGAGYAFWLLDSFNLSLNVDYHFQSYDASEGQPKSGDFLNVYLGFDWF